PSTNLRGANLAGADLAGAELFFTLLIEADLRGANLAGADLTGANLTGANLAGAILTGATLCETVLANCRDLHQAIGLTEVRHAGPSVLDVRTLGACAHGLPDVFLQGAGCGPLEIVAIRRAWPA